eukprot:364500-Chlamydomonas_euryale.AAC.2
MSIDFKASCLGGRAAAVMRCMQRYRPRAEEGACSLFALAPTVYHASCRKQVYWEYATCSGNLQPMTNRLVLVEWLNQPLVECGSTP